jgi:hypothetical protein
MPKPIVPSAPIPGSARDRMQQQANRMLPGIVDDHAPRVKRERVVLRAWGEGMSSMGYALALTLRVRPVKWGLRVLTLWLWFTLPPLLSGVLTMVVIIPWATFKVAKLVRRWSPKQPIDKCQCHE